jgi:hypothetical protein
LNSFAKRNTNSANTRLSGHRSHHRNYDSCNSTSSFRLRRRVHKRFFIKPHLRITGIKSYPQKIVFHNQDKKEELDCIVWTIKIKNKYGRISKNVNKCAAKIYFHIIQQELPLKWRSSSETYWNKDFYATSTENPKDTFSELGISCAFGLFKLGLENIDIPPNKENEVYFLVTFKDIQLPYLILRGNSSELVNYYGKQFLMPRWDGVDLVLQYREEFEFQIRFEGNCYYEEKGMESTLKINSWKDIKLN